MANQVDNLTLNDDTTGYIRTVNTASDDLFLSVDLTLQSGGVFTADNIKRGTADPNGGAGTAGNEGDIYLRTAASTGEVYVNTDGTATGWAKLILDTEGPYSNIASATAANVISSTSYTLVNSMTLTPASGTYLVWFSSECPGPSGINSRIAIYAGGVQDADSVRELDLFSTDQWPTGTQGRVTVNGSQAIEARCQTDSGTSQTFNQRSLVIVRVT